MNHLRAPRRAQPTLLYADEDIAVVEKPSDVLVVRRIGDEVTLGDLVLGESASALAVPVVPVDPDASGIVLFAQHADAAERLAAQKADGGIELSALVIVCGILEDAGVIDRRIAFDKRKAKVRIANDGDPAHTYYRVVERLLGHTLLECTNSTHREQQLRIHLNSIGAPLAVDPAHGGGTALFLSHFKPGYRPSRSHEERPLIGRLSLHLNGLRLAHPRTGAPIHVQSEPPKDFRAAVNQLRRWMSP